MDANCQSTTAKSCWWSVVINNPTEQDRLALLNPPDWVKNLSYQDEIAPTTGTLHIQGALNTQSVRFSAIKNWLPRANIQACYKSAKALQNYCKKSKTSVEGTYFEFHRDEPSGEKVIVEPPTEPLLDALLTIGRQFGPEFVNSDPAEIYRISLGEMILAYPHLLNTLTANRVGPTWNLLYLVMKKLAEEHAEMSAEFIEEEDSGQGQIKWDMPDTPEEIVQP